MTNHNNYSVKLCDKELKWVDSVRHPGTNLNNVMTETIEIRKKKQDLVQRVNYVLSILDNCNDEIITATFQSKCAHLYGCQSWNLQDKSIREFQVMWNRCVRRILKLPNCTHTKLLPFLLDSLSVMEQIQLRFAKIAQTMLKSCNVKVRHLCKFNLFRANTIIGANLIFISKNINCDIIELISKTANFIKTRLIAIRDHSFRIRAMQILELRHFYIPGFSNEEILILINFLCTY